VICSLCVLGTAVALWRLSETDLEWLAAIHGLVEAVTAGITWGATAWLISRTTSFSTREREVIRPFAIAVLIIWTTIFTVFIAGHLLAPGATIERMLVSGLLLLSFNVIPTAILARRILAQEASGPATYSPETSWEELAESHGVSPREAEVVQLVCQGRTNRQIADELCISLQTVKDHNYRIFRKLGVRNRVQLVNLVRNIR
jgi:DNA-binding CsgD family transcriptional regulator